MLLQVLDDGRLTDGQGRTVDFRNAILIMTSNIRSNEAMREHFRPEFLNRIDDIVVFKPLSREQIAEIVELQLGQLRARLAERELELELTDGAKDVIANEGWDEAYGARPLRRAIESLLVNRLALRLLEGDFAPGDTILVDEQNGDLVFTKASALAAGPHSPSSRHDLPVGRSSSAEIKARRRREARPVLPPPARRRRRRPPPSRSRFAAGSPCRA